MKRFGLCKKLMLSVLAVVLVFSAAPSAYAYILSSSNTVQNSFSAVYMPPEDITVPVMIRKNIVNLGMDEMGPGGFYFHLRNVDTGETVVTASLETGWAVIQLPFDMEDIGKTCRYSLCELNTGVENVTYDRTVYDIGISIDLNEENELYAVLTVDDAPVQEICVTFENEYFVPVAPPETGDDAQPLLWAAMMLSSALGLVVLKKKRFA